jgi:hypothetical protein
VFKDGTRHVNDRSAHSIVPFLQGVRFLIFPFAKVSWKRRTYFTVERLINARRHLTRDLAAQLALSLSLITPNKLIDLIIND